MLFKGKFSVFCWIGAFVCLKGIGKGASLKKSYLNLSSLKITNALIVLMET